MKRLLLFLLLLSLSQASLLWQFSTDGAVSAKPAVHQGRLIIASDDGRIYALDPASGSMRWRTVVGDTPNEVFVFDNAIFASTSSGKLVRLDQDGRIAWTLNLNVTQYNVSHVYGAAADQKYVFVSANNGVYLIEKNGSVRSKPASFNDTVVTPPGTGPDYAVYGAGRQLVKLRENGQKEWTGTLASDSFWLSRPVVGSGIIYVGALDNRMHAYAVTGGIELWDVMTHDWVLSTPRINGGTVYFGSDDAKVYAADAGSGDVLWSSPTQLAVQTEPEAGLMGGRDVVFVGSSDRSVYAMDQATGEIVWKGSVASGGVGSPLFYQNSVIFGSQDHNVYAYSTERACSITQPLEGDLIGFKEVEVRGKFVSESGGASVWVSVNGEDWEQANLTDQDWVFYIDPSSDFNAGLNTISCKVVDASGEESGEVFTTVAVNHDPNAPLSRLAVTVSPNIVEGVPFSIYVNDGDDGSPVNRFSLSIDGSSYTADKNVTLSLPAGTYRVAVRKIGFQDAGVNVTVNAKGVNPIYLAVGIVLILIIVWQVWARFLKDRFARKG